MRRSSHADREVFDFFLPLALSNVARTFPMPLFRASPFDDGGFFFIPNDSVRNKAGITGKDTTGRDRYASYGST